MALVTTHQQSIILYGWDSKSQGWYGPEELEYSLRGWRRLLDKLRTLPGSWYGRLTDRSPGQPPLSFCASIHDLGDSALGIIDLEGSPGGPLEVVAVVPGQRVKKLRPEFAFEFLAFLKFLEGAQNLGSELIIHDHIERVLKETDESRTLVFSIETRFVQSELHSVISAHVGKLTMSMVAWMLENDSAK